MAAPINGQTCHSIIPLVKPCSSTALRSYPSAYLSRPGSVIDNHFNCGGMIFFFGVSPFTAFHIPGKVPGTYRHRLHGLPRIPLPGHTRKIEFPKMMSTYKFSLCSSNLSFAGILFFDFYSGGVLSCSILSRSLPLFLLILSNNAPMNSAIPVLTLILIARTVLSSITALWMPVLKNGSSFLLNSVKGELPNEIPSHSC